MVDRESNGMLRRLVTEWDHLKAELERMHPAAEVRPSDGYRIFLPVNEPTSASARFDVSRMVFNLPERAADLNTDLFVVVEGRSSFRRSDFAERDILAIDEFKTRVAYFRRSHRSLAHVYGAHYEFSLRELGHPVFHGQIRSFPELAEGVKAWYGVEYAVEDRVKGVLRSVRVPTANMDVFSLFVQLCADHLLYTNSGPEERTAFNSLLERSAFCQGAAFQVPRLETLQARTCYRARHWYASIA